MLAHLAWQAHGFQHPFQHAIPDAFSERAPASGAFLTQYLVPASGADAVALAALEHLVAIVLHADGAAH